MESAKGNELTLTVRESTSMEKKLDKTAQVVNGEAEFDKFGFKEYIGAYLSEVSGGYGLRKPNPFSDETVFIFRLGRTSDVTLNIYTVPGKLLKTLIDDEERR